MGNKAYKRAEDNGSSREDDNFLFFHSIQDDGHSPSDATEPALVTRLLPHLIPKLLHAILISSDVLEVQGLLHAYGIKKQESFP